MKNFQQTPKQRRVRVAAAKTAFANSRNKGFQPREAWGDKKNVAGVPVSVLVDKQGSAPRGGYGWYFWP